MNASSKIALVTEYSVIRRRILPSRKDWAGPLVGSLVLVNQPKTGPEWTTESSTSASVSRSLL
jgi:hypothetical protein